MRAAETADILVVSKKVQKAAFCPELVKYMLYISQKNHPPHGLLTHILGSIFGFSSM
jgi:hypothetical protein